ncbi:MAG: hypothetical protein R2705_09390 [Ilumatobacteraceae bacterium]
MTEVLGLPWRSAALRAPNLKKLKRPANGLTRLWEVDLRRPGEQEVARLPGSIG